MQDRAFALTVPADPRYLKVIRAFFGPVLEDLFGEKSGLLILALDESCSNIVKHRCGSLADDLIQVRVIVQPDRLRIRLGDFCAAADVPKIRPRDLEDVKPGGLGTHFIDQIMDRVVFEPEPERPGRVALVMEKAIPRSEAKDADQV
jgi:sigma-B regulation protein RsbU (phosphoserine phosphatase)